MGYPGEHDVAHEYARLKVCGQPKGPHQAVGGLFPEHIVVVPRSIHVLQTVRCLIGRHLGEQLRCSAGQNPPKVSAAAGVQTLVEEKVGDDD